KASVSEVRDRGLSPARNNDALRPVGLDTCLDSRGEAWPHAVDPVRFERRGLVEKLAIKLHIVPRHTGRGEFLVEHRANPFPVEIEDFRQDPDRLLDSVDRIASDAFVDHFRYRA